jgi:protein gp37
MPDASRAGSVSWMIAGCESRNGRPGRRPTADAWVRDLRDQCHAASVAFWLKQLVRDRQLIELPELDGRTWAERPSP